MTDETAPKRRYDPIAHAAAVKDLQQRERLLDRVHAEIAEPTSAQDAYDHRKVSDASPIAWNAPVAMLMLDVEAGARDLEKRLRYNLGLPWLPVEDPRGYRFARPPGRKHANLALDQTVVLAETLHGRSPDDELCVEAQRTVERWGKRARGLLDELRPDERPWTKAPSIVCAYCANPLWLKPGWENAADLAKQPAYCRSCRDDEGAMLEYASVVWAAAVNEHLEAS